MLEYKDYSSLTTASLVKSSKMSNKKPTQNLPEPMQPPIIPSKHLMIIGWDDDFLGMYQYFPSIDSPAQNPSKIKFEMRQSEDGERVFRFDLVSRHLRWLQGEVLTVIDAVITNDKQLKATKDLVKGKFSSKIDWLYQLGGLMEDQQDGLIDPTSNHQD